MRFDAPTRLFLEKKMITCIDFTADNQTIAIASKDGAVKLWNSRGELLQKLSNDYCEIVDVKFNPVGDMIAIASNDGIIQLWSLENKLLKTKPFKSRNYKGRLCISFSPDGTMIAIATSDPTIQLWHLDSDTIERLSEYESNIHQVTFSPDAKMIASVNQDNTVILWNLEGKIHTTLMNVQNYYYPNVFGYDYYYPNFCGKVVFSSNSPTLATISLTEIKIWTSQGELLETIKNTKNNMLDAYFLQNHSDILALIRDDQTIELWSIYGEVLQTIHPVADNSYIDFAACSSDGSTVVVANSKGLIKLWHLGLDNILKYSKNFIHDYLVSQQ